MEGLYSIKSDVFSFGVLLLEIISGKRNAEFHLATRTTSLLSYVSSLYVSSVYIVVKSLLDIIFSLGAAGMATME